MESAWAYEENKVSQVCPRQLLNGFPGTAIIDNDDFREDTLTGGGTSHRTNMLFVQSEKLESEHLPSTQKLNIPTKEQKNDMTLPQISTDYILQKEEEIHYRAPIMIQISVVIPTFNVIEDFFMSLLEEQVLSLTWIQVIN